MNDIPNHNKYQENIFFIVHFLFHGDANQYENWLINDRNYMISQNHLNVQ